MSKCGLFPPADEGFVKYVEDPNPSQTNTGLIHEPELNPANTGAL